MKERATVLCVRDNRILLVASERSRWALPGGRIRRAEAPHQAALRELEEETMLVANELFYLFQFLDFNRRHIVFFADVAKYSRQNSDAFGERTDSRNRGVVLPAHWRSWMTTYPTSASGAGNKRLAPTSITDTTWRSLLSDLIGTM